MARCLVVNANDFGMSRGVNDGIASAHTRGIVTSASLCAIGEAFDDAVSMARTLPSLGIGVHLAWVDGRPLSDPARIPTLVDGTGRLHDRRAFFRRYVQGRISLDEVVQEAAAQTEWVRAAGIMPDHLNGEQHLHALPGIFEGVVSLARRYRIPAVRRTREPLNDVCPRGYPKRLVLRFADALHAVGTGNEIWFPQWCFGLADSCYLTERRLVRLLAAVPNGISELMCHPSVSGGEPGARMRELAALTSGAARAAVASAGVTLTTFGAYQPAACAAQEA